MAELKGSKTEKNLMAAFAGESQARNKYTYYASKAKKDGFVQIANIFEETANNEKEHAKIWFKLLDGIGCARGGQIIGGCERHLLTARNDRGRGEDGEGKIRMLLRQHGGDPCAFRFGVDAGFRSAHARPFSQDFQRFRIVVRAGHVVAVQHGVVVEPLVRHESGDAGRRHRVHPGRYGNRGHGYRHRRKFCRREGCL